jgi:hypothetical protein
MKSEEKAIRGVYEHPAGSGVWWINYYANGQRHREKVGRKGDAIKLYRTRKSDALAGRKLPQLRNTKQTTVSDLIDLALQATEEHKDRRNYLSKAEIVRTDLGNRPASEVAPQEIENWLKSKFRTPATSNRYKAFISLCYRQGMRNGKVTSNPARLFSKRAESAGRIRYLSRDEYNRVCDAQAVPGTSAGVRCLSQYRNASLRAVFCNVVTVR